MINSHLFSAVLMWLMPSPVGVKSIYPDLLPSSAHQAGELQELLKKQGYIAIPLMRSSGGKHFYLKGSIHGSSFNFMIDTGAAENTISGIFPHRFNVEVVDSGGTVIGLGGQVPKRVAHIDDVCLGSMKIPTLKWLVIDMLEVSRRMLQDDAILVSGVIGSPLLTYYSAVIDTAGNTLYLLDPVKKEPRLQGEFLLVQWSDGKGTYLPPGDGKHKLVIAGTKVTYCPDIPEKQGEYSLVLDLKSNPKRMNWIDKAGKALPAIYHINDNGTMWMAIPIHEGEDVTKTPGSFYPTKGDAFSACYFVPAPRP